MPDETIALTPEKQTLLAVRALRRRVDELEQAQREPIAIVGMACRIPGGVNDPQAFWKLLQEKGNAVAEIPRERLDVAPIFDPHPQTPGKTHSRWAGMLAAPGDFDAEFFGISPREALSADPQQRLLLEASWEALEDAGIDPKSLAGQDAAVFIGICMSEYAQYYQECMPKEALAAHFIQGSALNATCGRISYFYGLQGPSMAIDTACSSSLVAVDRACRSLLQRETSLAIAGGVNLLATTDMLIMASQWGMLSPRGACRAFGQGADGFVRGEGCGVLVLKRLRDAEANGDRVLAVILGSAVNQDGASSGLTVPNGQAQQELVRRALANAGVEPWQVGYVEAHGTGTALGDPIEAEALGAVFGSGRKRERPLLLGSVKTNIGHLEAAAGIAGLIKVVLGLKHGVVPAQLCWEGPSERVRWSELPLEIVAEARPWNAIEGRRIAGVSSFGFSGTNAHVVVEGLAETLPPEVGARPAEVLVVTARTAPALRELADRYAGFLETTQAAWGEICHTAGTGRAVFAERLAVVAADKAEAAEHLRTWLKDEAGAARMAGISRGRLRAGERVRVGLVLGTGLEELDELIGTAPQSEAGRKEAWEAKLLSWGVHPVAVTFSTAGDAEAQLKTAAVTLTLVLGNGEIGLPTIPLTGTGGWRELAGAVAELFVRGVRIKWTGWEVGLKRHPVELPAYAFQRERFWVEAQGRKRELAGDETGRKLLGRRLRAAGVQAQFEAELGPEGATSWIGEHLVGGHPVLPATGHLELMLEAGAEALKSGAIVVEDAVLQAPLMLQHSRVVQTVIEPSSAGRSRVRLYVESDVEGAEGEWQVVSEGWIRTAGESSWRQADEDRVDLEEIRGRLEQRNVDEFYSGMVARGLEFGATFRGLAALWSGPEEALGEVRAIANEEGYAFAPWRLDACLQAVGTLLGDSGAPEPGMYLPLSLGELKIDRVPPERCWSHVRARRIDADTFIAGVTITDCAGMVQARLRNLRLRKRAPGRTQAAIYGVDWIPAAISPSPVALHGHWLIFAAGQDIGAKLAQRIGKQGGICSLVLAQRDESVTSAGSYFLNPAEEPETADLLRALIAKSGPLAGVVHACAEHSRNQQQGHRPPDVSRGYGSALALLQALIREQIKPSQGVWFVTRGVHIGDGMRPSVSAEGNAIWALRRTAALEFPELRTYAADLAAESDVDDLLRWIGSAPGAEVAIKNGAALEPRLVERKAGKIELTGEENMELRPSASGLIDDLAYISVSRQSPRDDEVEIEVHAHGVNFRDVMNALGMLPGLPQQLGGECAGLVVRAGARSGFRAGDRVFGFALGSFTKFVTVTARNVAIAPLELSLAQAAALPVVYLTALLGLDRLAKLQCGERILIHSAAGGLGLAAVYVARARGAEIYATAGSEEKRAYLRSLGIERVLHSRTTDFAAEVMRFTHGRGVDVVLNSLTGALAGSTLSVLATGGRFLEVGKRDVLTREQVHRSRPDVEYFKYDLSEEASLDPSLVPALLSGMLNMLAEGSLTPLPVTEFEEPREAFRFMAQARHIGKIAVIPTLPRSLRAPIAIDPKATYLVTGGSGGLGLHCAEWLVRRGARHLLLLSRHGASPAVEETIARMSASGARVQIASVDVSDRAAVDAILRDIPIDTPLKGILHAAGVLDDRSLLNQTCASFVDVARPKWEGAWNLHTLTEYLPLDFFVMFSSASALIGMPGQANYAAANAMLDALAAYRRSRQMPAVSIQWGPWAGAGMAESLKLTPASFGLGWIAPEQGASALETILTGSDAVTAVLPVASWSKFVSRRPQAASSLFSSLVDATQMEAQFDFSQNFPGPPEPGKQGVSATLVESLKRATPAERRVLLLEHLRQQAAQILSLAPRSAVDEEASLRDLGLDSLMAVELRNALQISLDRQLSPTLVLDYPTLHTLREALLTEMFGSEKSGKMAAPAIAGIDGIDIDELSDSEAEALLLEELEK